MPKSQSLPFPFQASTFTFQKFHLRDDALPEGVESILASFLKQGYFLPGSL